MGGQKNTQFVWTPTKRRGPIAAEFSTPGPAAIGLPTTFGSKVTVTKSRSPAFTISGRHESRQSTASPGPGQYNINGLTYKAGKDEPHAPSMHIRPKDPKIFVTPAPGDYCPEKSKKVLDPSPKFSFGIKTDPGLPSDIPGPGSYNDAVVDKYKTIKSPAFSMGQRTNIPSDHTQKPGPGAHFPEKYVSDCTPSWTMSPKTEMPTDKTPKPSPNAYCPEKYNLDSTPRWTMSPRTELYTDKSPKPSPNAYSPDETAMIRRNPEFSFGVRHSPYLGTLRDQ